MSLADYKESDAVKELATSLEEMLKDESRWKIVSRIHCLPHDLPFMFMQPEYHAWKFYMRSEQDDVDIDYENRCFGEPRLRFKGKTLNKAAQLGQSLQRVFRELAYPLHDKLYWEYRQEWEAQQAREALNPIPTNPVEVVRKAASWWKRFKGFIVSHT